MNLQTVKWIDEELKAEVYDCNGKFVREIKYSNRQEYIDCQNLYFINGGK